MTSIGKLGWKGIFVIPPTPFHDNLEVDYEGLRNILRFSVDCGAHGIVANANASESPFLTESERRKTVELAIKECKGKVPVIIGVSSPAAPMSIEYAKFAAASGADGLMAMPPTQQRPSEAEIRSYYKALGQATPLPIFIQNWGGPGGTPMSAKFVTDIIRDNPTCCCVKEETEYASQVMSEILSLAGSDCKVMLGGKTGRPLLEEYRRGGRGTMPACEIPDIQSRLWSRLEAGDEKGAEELHRAILPLLVFEIGNGPYVWKAVLKRRGIIRGAAVRQTGGRKLDQAAIDYIDHLLRGLAPLMDPRYPLPN
jgi:dihydrodipicolinate synthase/N-acetylneuraminate lyase